MRKEINIRKDYNIKFQFFKSSFALSTRIAPGTMYEDIADNLPEQHTGQLEAHAVY